MLTSAGKALIARFLMEETGYDTGLTYCALGSDGTAPAVGDIDLGTEEVRQAFTSTERSGNEITLSTFFLASNVTFYIKEQGTFGHSTAGAGADSGEMFNRDALDYDNSGGSNDITVDVKITIG